MRSAAAALALGLLLIASGCGTSSAATQTSSGTDAASLVPASALAYVSADANLDSQQWQVLTDVFGPLPSKLDYKNDIHPALGDRVNLAVLGIDNGQPEAVALVQPTDEAKLSALAKKFDQGSEHYTVEQIGGWSVVADSAEAFQSVRNADSGSSLADTANFKSAMSQVGDAGFATVYASGSGVQQLPAKLQALVRVAGSPRWVAASITADKTALQIKARAAGGTSPAAYRPALLRDVPSGAILAVSFKDVNQLLARVQSEPLLRTSLPPFVTACAPSAARVCSTSCRAPSSRSSRSRFIRVILSAAATALRGVAAKAGNMLPLHVERHGKVVLLTNAAPGTSPGSGSITDDQSFKDALAAADVPAKVTWLAYADIQRLAPLLQALASLTGNGQAKPATTEKLDKFQTLVAFGARSGSTSSVEARLTFR